MSTTLLKNECYQYKNTVSQSAESSYGEVCMCGSKEVIARANIELYDAAIGDSNWELINLGTIYLVQNQNIYCLILFCIDSTQAVWRRQVNRNIIYHIDKPYFHIICIKDELFGLNFADLTEAEIFSHAVERLWHFKSFDNVLRKITNRFLTLFSRKRIPRRVPCDRFQCPKRGILKKDDRYCTDVQKHSRGDDGPTKMATYPPDDVKGITRFQSYPDKHAHYSHRDRSDAYVGTRDFRSYSHRPPKPPPLPPPVSEFQIAPRSCHCGAYRPCRHNAGLRDSDSSQFQSLSDEESSPDSVSE